MVKVIYDGVNATVVNEMHHSVELKITEKAPWSNSPAVGSLHWVRKDDKHLSYVEVNNDC